MSNLCPEGQIGIIQAKGWGWRNQLLGGDRTSGSGVVRHAARGEDRSLPKGKFRYYTKGSENKSLKSFKHQE